MPSDSDLQPSTSQYTMTAHRREEQLEEALRTLQLITHPKPSFLTATHSKKHPLDSPLPDQKPLGPSQSSRSLISTPALEAARSSLATRREKRLKKKTTSLILPTKTRDLPHNQPEIHPNDPTAFLNRLSTFKLANYPAGKPRSLSPPNLASFGWTSVPGTKNRLKCEVCQATWVLAVPSVKAEAGWGSPSGIQLAKLGSQMRVEEHRKACPWRKRRCTPNIYSRAMRWSGGLEATTELVQIATGIEELLSDQLESMSLTKIEHPLSEADFQFLSAAVDIIKRKPSQSSPQMVSDSTLIFALFGWFAGPIPPLSPSRPASPMPSNHRLSVSTVTQVSPLKNRTISCQLCHRQIGLWSILSPSLPDTAPARPSLNMITSHRDYCPYRDNLAGFEESDYQAFDPHPPELTWKANLLLIRRLVERHQHANQAATQPNCLDNLIRTFMDTNESSFRPPSSRSDSQIWALGFVKSRLSKGVGSDIKL
ncbi:hypothetical protein CROQUDRAFT_658546 [Cronartium quercuum f. sp. fusiforme G11]|uniref:Zf-C3HC-domain-containing protein n=1 Tax=Cronartium quercuum f. sp. fusiforme G11 TaxID=708437 RepID=A0A9P6TBA8_9BASI|nr:hypothetical protein CROQUDRAFT_658546 [Cronartium quercuum f. sp. fusiforme G11]